MNLFTIYFIFYHSKLCIVQVLCGGDLHEKHTSQVTKRAIRAINPNGDRPLHVSFDIDALDPTEAPATGTRGKYVFVILFKHRKKKGKICHMMMAL